MTTTATAATIPAQAQPLTAEQEHGSRIITALEAAWAAIRAAHPEVPRVVMITGTGRDGRGSLVWGHFGADFWTVDKEQGTRAPELFAGGELLSQGGRRTMQTLLHEAAHAVAHVRGIKDHPASGGRYHNRKFAAIATEMGLTPPKTPHKILGFSDCHITDETAEKFADAIRALDAAQLPHVPLYGLPADPGTGTTGGGTEGGDGDGDDDTEKPEPKRAGKRFAIQCQCAKPRKIQITYAAWEATDEDDEDGGIVCTRCGAEFAPVPKD